MADEHGVWDPLSPAEVTDLFRDSGFAWWIAGGWAIDLFVGRTTRSHADVDVQILRRDQLAVQARLATWDLHAADPPGTLRPWKPGEILLAHVHDIWCRPSPASPWALQLMVADADADRWIFRRDPRVSRPLAALSRQTPAGFPYLAPEIQLLFKARAQRPKDESDFAVVLPHVEDHGRAWLAAALRTCYPEHPWIGLLG